MAEQPGAPESKKPAASGSSSAVLESNIRTLCDMRRREEERRSKQDRFADAITRFSGSMMFVYLHVLWFGGWVLINSGKLGIEPFDPFPHGLLTTIVSLEAIFLATFVLISQNRMAKQADRRAELDLQINLLAEHEVTRVLKIVDAIADHLGLPEGQDEEVEELKQDVSPEELARRIQDRERALGLGAGKGKEKKE